MMKFFRKNTKTLLAVFMALLLVVWLAGDALTSLIKTQQDVTKEVRGQAFGKEIKLQQMLPAFNEAKTLDELLGPSWRYPWATVLAGMLRNPQMGQFLPYLARQVRPQPLTDEEWYMIDAAARRNGIVVSPERVNQFKEQNNLESRIEYAHTTYRLSGEEIDRAIQAYLRLEQAIGLALDVIKVSEADIESNLKAVDEKAKIVAVTVDAKPFIDANYQPTEAELKDQFEKYKNTASRPGDTASFGYQIPDAVQVEYIAVNPEPLAKRQKITEDEIYQYWQSHKNEFLRPTTQPVSTQPTSRPTPQPYETFSEARHLVAEKLQKENSRKEALDIARNIITQLQAPWATVTTSQPTDVKQAPESEKAADVYSKLVDRLQEKYPGVLKYGRTQLLDASALEKQPELGAATAMASANQRITLPEAAEMVPGLETTRTRQNERFFRGLYETAAEPFVAPDGTAYVIRTIAAKPRHAPDSLDAVKSEVVQDIRRMKAYDEAGRQAQALATKAGTQGLQAAFSADAALKTKLGDTALKTPPPFARMQLQNFLMPMITPEDIPGIGSDADLMKAIFATAATAGTQPASAGTQPAASQPIRVATQPQKNEQRWIVYQVLEVLPPTTADYAKDRGAIAGALLFRRQMDVLSQWFSPQQIRARINWQDAPGRGPAKPQTPEEEEM